jgi:hypothetical protein
VEVIEQLLRLGRRGAELRPFCVAAGVQHRALSRPLQRAITDFGAECSFARAAARIKEHYGIEVPTSAVRQQTLRHARQMAVVAEEVAPKPTVPVLITELDGSMVPVMEPGQGPDRRKGKKVSWREARLCCARSSEAHWPLYSATLSTLETVGWMWQQTARMAGLGPKTLVHGVGDGAPWIVEKFRDTFGGQGRYLLDFYHVSDYLGAAALTVARPGKQKLWLRRQQGRLLDNRLHSVLRALEKHQEPPGAAETPVRTAYQYLQNRRQHLDYATARREQLPIGSGEIEGGHRHVIQQRLKISGGWWRETNMEAMLQLRVARANNWWDSYWAKARN